MPDNRIIYLFNPQNDLCLANGSRNFTPPASAVKLAQAGACLPMWYAKPGSYFWGAVNAKWYKEITETFGTEVFPTQMPLSEGSVKPWGWSLQTREYLLRCGFSVNVLPSVETVENWRNLSSRVTNVPLLERIISLLPDTPDGPKSPRICRSREEALRTIREMGRAILKLPWSGSGRGQQISDRTTAAELEIRIDGMIKHQGAIEISPYYDKLSDFAMLWDEGGFAGFSFFRTDTHGGWTENLLLDDEVIMHQISECLGFPVGFSYLIEKIGSEIEELASRYGYKGPVGVDFLVARGEKDNFLVPVEVNWRRTMGHVAHNLKKNYMADSSQGHFRIVDSKRIDEPYHYVASCVISEKRIETGTLDLVPPGGAFRFLLEAGKNDSSML